ncbi:hypothetical protein LINPERPRIM_LOCUS39289 [Linum perenne]
MQQSSAVAQEPGPVSDLVVRFGRLAFNPAANSNGSCSFRSNSLYFDRKRTSNSRRVVASLRLGGGASSCHREIWNEFNRFIRFHCARIPIGFSSLRVGPADSASNSNGLNDGSDVLVDDGLPINAAETKTSKKVLILMSDTGGGHRASAEAIKAAFNDQFGDEYQVFIIDLWSEHTPWPFNQLPRSYNFLVKHKTLWKMTYYGTAPQIIHQSNFRASAVFIARQAANGIMKYKPDIIISVHPLMQHVPLSILRTKGLLRKIVFTTVITDLSTCHPTWLDFFSCAFHKLVSRCYCPSQDVAKRALKAGLQPHQIKIYGLPVRPSFVKSVRPKVELRKELGMDEDLPAVLLMGGGEGMGPIEATARALGDSLYDENLGGATGQVLVICGRNKKLANKLALIDWKIPVQAGPGTIAEAMIRGLPIILNDFIAGQEVGNVPYVVQNECGKFSKSPKEIASIVAQWFGPKKEELKVMSQNALKLARPDAVVKIVNDMHELVRQRSSSYSVQLETPISSACA